MLEVKNIDYFYLDGGYKHQILEDVSCSFDNGVFYTIIGESGSGKTTFLSLLGALDKPIKGDIRLDNKSIFEDIDDYHQNEVGFVAQSYNLIEYMNATENIELALDIAKNKQDKKYIKELLELVGLDESKTKRVVYKLSGGERQRIAIARALANNAKIILADEPTGNLDFDTSKYIVDIFKKLAHEMNKCVIVVTHNKEIANESDVIMKVDQKNKKIIIVNKE